MRRVHVKLSYLLRLIRRQHEELAELRGEIAALGGTISELRALLHRRHFMREAVEAERDDVLPLQ